MSTKKQNNATTALQWLDEESKNHILEIVWEGGGDSGWVHFEKDETEFSNQFTDMLIDYMHDELNYGSWAGEFQSNGRAEYNPKTKCFEGMDYYGEDESRSMNTKITIKVPENLWFDQLIIETEGNYDDAIDVSVRFIIKNGFVTPQHEDFINNLKEGLKEKIQNEIDGITDFEIRGCWNNVQIQYSQFDKDENPGFLSYSLMDLDVTVYKEDDRTICLDLSEIDAMNQLIDEKGNIIEDESV